MNCGRRSIFQDCCAWKEPKERRIDRSVKDHRISALERPGAVRIGVREPGVDGSHRLQQRHGHHVTRIHGYHGHLTCSWLLT